MGGIVSSIFGGDKKAPEPMPVAAAAPMPEAPAIAARTPEFDVREQAMGQRASAAGAQRSDNDADVLGFALPRKRSAGRAILG